MPTVQDIEGVEELTPEKSRDLFERQARRYLNMSGDEFVEAWREGKFADREDEEAVAHVVKLLPLVS